MKYLGMWNCCVAIVKAFICISSSWINEEKSSKESGEIVTRVISTLTMQSYSIVGETNIRMKVSEQKKKQTIKYNS